MKTDLLAGLVCESVCDETSSTNNAVAAQVESSDYVYRYSPKKPTRTVGHKSHDPWFHVFLMERRVMTFVPMDFYFFLILIFLISQNIFFV